MNPRLKQQLLRWWLAGVNAFNQGGALAIKGFAGLATVNAAGVQVPTLNLKQAAYLFLAGGAYHFADYLIKNPLPIQVSAPVIPAPTQNAT